MKKGKVFIISAPSGAGKTTVANEVIKRLQKNNYPISKVITYTTRPPRKDEINGIDYYFLSKEEFENKQKNSFFLETTVYNDKLYGSPASVLEELELGKSFVFVTDLAGVKSLSKKFEDPCCIWINAPSIDDLRKRLVSRGSNTEKQIEERINLAKEEIKEAEELKRLFNYYVVNDSFEETVNDLMDIIKKTFD